MNEARQRLVEEAQRTIAAGSKSFRFASQIFDLKTRERSWLLYAWCRACDDITDGQTLGHDAVSVDNPQERIAFLRANTDAALAGRPTGLAPFDGLAIVAAETRIPADLPNDHLAGFDRDAAGWTPTSEEDLLSYCYQVAGAVGVMMAHVMGVDPAERDTLERASDLGIAFQLANIARDIVDDARVGRSYIPTEWAVDLDPLDPAQRPRLVAIAKRLAALANRYRTSSKVGAARLPFRSRWAILSAAAIYGEVANRAVKLGPAAWDQRISISKAEKFALVAKAWSEALLPARNISRDGLWTRPISTIHSARLGKATKPARPTALTLSLSKGPRQADTDPSTSSG